MPSKMFKERETNHTRLQSMTVFKEISGSDKPRINVSAQNSRQVWSMSE